VKKLKLFLQSSLGQSSYLQLTSRIFFLAFRRGWLKANPMYHAHYFVANLIKPGDTVLDIGANLGYYTTNFARLTGTKGKVIAVEPIPLYRNILVKNTEKLEQVSILPYALGERETTIEMGNPGDDKHRHGLMHVLSEKEKMAGGEIFEVPMKNPLQLFAGLDKIDYIKCDIEGYEIPVMPLMKPLIKQYQPIVQVEVEPTNIPAIFSLFDDLGYTMFNVIGTSFKPYKTPEQHNIGDLFCIPNSHTKAIQHLIADHA